MPVASKAAAATFTPLRDRGLPLAEGQRRAAFVRALVAAGRATAAMVVAITALCTNACAVGGRPTNAGDSAKIGMITALANAAEGKFESTPTHVVMIKEGCCGGVCAVGVVD